jgi:hypothetical protein
VAEPPPRVEQVKERRLAVLVAAIAVVASAVGAVAVGYASYLGNKSLESSKGESAARGAARVLQAQLETVDVRLHAMLAADRLYEIDEAYNVGLPQSDEQLVATHVSADDWTRVASAIAAVRLYTATDDEEQRKANASLAVRLSDQRRAYIRNTSEAVEQGAEGLRSLAGTGR